jgi:hypothetical protein
VANNQADERGAHSGTNGEEGYIIQRKKKKGPKGASTFSKFFFGWCRVHSLFVYFHAGFCLPLKWEI